MRYIVVHPDHFERVKQGVAAATGESPWLSMYQVVSSPLVPKFLQEYKLDVGWVETDQPAVWIYDQEQIERHAQVFGL